ncbi:general stress protein [Planococcus sp. ISL-109]|uniref:general stress protein n=1 Tax=Planococcus sp. ISL-109 TaxID=2819166 RepID=UPI001BEBCF3B|nr:general stress protein [Planococcus sp. ISL-109]MBT2581676.1 general stress protein [Planococcus sp. ISL-109]
MAQTNRQYEIVYSQEEMEQALDTLIARGYRNEDIHVLANDKNMVKQAHDRYGVDAYKANSFKNRMKIFLTGENEARTKLEQFGLDRDAVDHYDREIERGAVLLYTDGTPSGSGESEHFSSHSDDNRPMDLEGEDRNTAFAPFGRDIEREGRQYNEEKILDKDDQKHEKHRDTGVKGIYTTDATREETNKSQPHSKSQDSRLKGDEIHPTGDRAKPSGAEKPAEKRMDHEPELGTSEGEKELNREDGVNRRQNEPSPGADPNLGPAPFGRDSEEEHLLNDRRDDFESPKSPRNVNDFHNQVEKKTGTPPTPRLF